MADDIPSALIGLAGALVGGGITSATTWLIARSERQKFIREKLWDSRREAYAAIMASHMRAARWVTALDLGYSREGEQFHSSEARQNYQSRLDVDGVETHDIFERYAVLVSTAFFNRFVQFERDASKVFNDPNLIPPETAKQAAQVFRNSLKELRELVRQEINPFGIA